MVSLTPSFQRPTLVFLFLVGTVVFAAAYSQAPLYYSNQHQYFLHGMARAGVGLLHEDWLANTRDPTPLFSGLVAFTVRYLHPWVFYLFYALVLGTYAAATIALFGAVVGMDKARKRWPIFAVLLVLIHSALLRFYSYRWLGQDYPWYLQSGLAGQYVLGPTFQPSVFGVLLVASIAFFVHDRAVMAAISAALAATMHSTYLLPAGLVVLGYLACLVAERRIALAVGIGVLSLALVLPIILYVLLTFAPTSPQTFARAQDVLVNVRIPHHCRPDRFMDLPAVLQIVWIVLGIALATSRRLLIVLAVPTVLALLLSLVQAATGSHTLALLFPWRISAVLVPVATTIILAHLTVRLPVVAERSVTLALAVIVVAILMVGGTWISVGRLGFQTSDEELPLLNHVRQSRRPGDRYFLPVHVPNLLDNPRGIPSSSDFKPLAEKKQDGRVIPVDLQRFRLDAGVPIFVDFKAIPYKDTDVLEWERRIRLAQAVQEQIHTGKLVEALAQLRREGITHLVVVKPHSLESLDVEITYEDARYRVYRIAWAEPT